MKLGPYYFLFYPIFVTLLLFQFSLNFAHSCSPRGGLIRRNSRKPLYLKQRVPDVSEFSIKASGKAQGKITRNSSKFNSLVSCYSTDIVFKDEEGTGADRIMSKRLRDKLRNLAKKVREKWRGSTRLRVIEAWDEDGTHSAHSLHYEGRAVDITTSDLDKQKYPELGRLAVEAGFDWVFYESQEHIHASVYHYKDDGNPPWRGCFTSNAMVLLESGKRIPIKNLKPGQKVQAMDDDGNIAFSEVLLFLDFNPWAKNVSYVMIETEKPFKRLALTKNHLIFYKNTNSTDSLIKAKLAGLVKSGEYLMVDHEGTLVASRVNSVITSTGDGMIAPLTKHGNLFVDGVLASCYSEVTDHYIAHMAFTPVRFVQNFAPGLLKKLDISEHQKGLHWFPRFLIWLNKRLGIVEFASSF